VLGNVMGLATAWLVNASRAILLALDELLDRPEVLTEAHSAAVAGDLERLRRILWELLRFRAVSAGLLRTCLTDHEITGRNGRRTLVPAGAQVFVGTQSAMFDTAAVPQPDAFRTDRPEATYLFFGYGLHRCFGEQVARQQLPALLAPLLRLPGLRRAPGRAGRLRWDGAFPDGLSVSVS
jgi:cytochrome P450